MKTFFFFFFFFFNGCTCNIWKLSGQGANPSHSYDLCHSYDNARSLTHCTGPWIQPVPLQRQHGFLNPLSHSGNYRRINIFFFLFLGLHLHPWKFPGQGSYWNCTCQPTPQQHRIQAVSVTCTAPHGNTRSLNHWVRPRIKPTSTWVLVGFITCQATMETPSMNIFNDHDECVHIARKFVLNFCFVFCFLGMHLWHMEVPRLGVELELQLLAYATATATQDPSRLCNLHLSSWQRRILSPLSKTRDWTCVLMDTSWVHYPWSTVGTPDYPRLLTLPHHGICYCSCFQFGWMIFVYDFLQRLLFPETKTSSENTQLQDGEQTQVHREKSNRGSSDW